MSIFSNCQNLHAHIPYTLAMYTCVNHALYVYLYMNVRKLLAISERNRSDNNNAPISGNVLDLKSIFRTLKAFVATNRLSTKITIYRYIRLMHGIHTTIYTYIQKYTCIIIIVIMMTMKMMFVHSCFCTFATA